MKIVAWTSSQKRFSTSGNQKDKQMKTIKTIKTCCVLIGAASLFATSNLFANITGTGTATVNENYGDDLINVATTSSTGADLGSFFYTFCLNSGVFVNTPGTYSYTISDSAIPGGPGNVSTPDPISIGTAWLYSQFRAGTLASYSDTAAVNGALQAAIWWLEGEAGGVNNSFVALAETALSLNDTTIKDDANGAYDVVALHLKDSQGKDVQPLLGLVVPVPEPSTIVAGALLLLPFGVSTLRIMRKNKVQ
jgi:hypothetical protein